jgi:hypothetical protein
MCISAVAQASFEGVAAFTVKNVFYYYGFAPIRAELEKLISTIASRQFGALVGGFVGQQMSVVLAMPVTVVFAEALGWFTRETLRTMHSLCTQVFCPTLQPKGPPPFWLDVVLRMVSCATGFFSKAYFCSYAMPLVQRTIQHAITLLPVYTNTPGYVVLVMAPLVIVATPAVTFMLGDILSWVVEEASYQVMNITCELLTPDADTTV